MVRFVGCCFGTALFFCLVSPVHAQTTGLSVDKEHLSGISEAHFAYLEGWQTGDLLIRSATTGNGRYITEGEVEGPDAMSVVIRLDYLSRVVFDYDLERALVINRCKREVRLFNALDEEVQRPAISGDHRVLLYDKTANLDLKINEAGEIQRESKLSEFRSVLPSMGVPGVQSWGCGESSRWNLESLRRGIEFSSDVHNMASLENVGKNVYRLIAKDLAGERGDFRWQYETDWDVQRNVPVKYVAYHGPPGKHGPVSSSSAKWKLIDDCFVPESASSSRRSIERFAERRFHLKEETTADVHWFSFNSELSKELFSENLLHDREKLDELLNTDVFEDKPKDK